MDKTIKFEEALKQLEDTVKSLEGEGLTLEEALDHYQQGIKLVLHCRRCLEEVEGKLQVILSQEEETVKREIKQEGGSNDHL